MINIKQKLLKQAGEALKRKTSKYDLQCIYHKVLIEYRQDDRYKNIYNNLYYKLFGYC